MLNVTLAQINTHTGNITANTAHILAIITKAKSQQPTDVLIFPELALSGYPPEDLLLRPDFLQKIQQALLKIVQQCKDIYVILGYPQQTVGGLYNAAVIIHNGKIIARYFKQKLPNYSVFDEKRYFIAGNKPCVVDIKGIKFGITICEDLWHPEPIAQAKAAGAEMIISINASPFDYEKPSQRLDKLRTRQQETGLPILYTHLVGGQDELVFDGGSFILNAQGKRVAQAPYFKTAYLSINIDQQGKFVNVGQAITGFPATEQLVYEALVLAVNDYINKNHFHGAIIGLSGGIDSALTLAIAVDAIGADKVQAVMLPSRYTSKLSLTVAAEQAQILQVNYSVMSIEQPVTVFSELLREACADATLTGTTEENLQARCRGILLMALSNNSKRLVLTTGNKSEMSVGYTTLYGDMAGGFAVLKDVPKTLVYRLANYRNTLSAVIPQAVIDRPPTAELANDQVDANSLPPYAILDAILQRYVEKDEAAETIIKAGFPSTVVEKVINLVKHNEYKRRQAPLGPRVTPRAYGRDRRYPITSGF